jgi:hypothetical protein
VRRLDLLLDGTDVLLGDGWHVLDVSERCAARRGGLTNGRIRIFPGAPAFTRAAAGRW